MSLLLISKMSTTTCRNKIPLVVVLGATGTGKSKLAVAIARRFNGEVINADAMQVYKGLDIMTNKISEAEQMGIPHHLLGFLDPLKRFSVVDFRNRCLPLLDDVIRRNKMPVIVGGTHYYLESVLWKVLVDESTDAESLVFDTFGKRKYVDEISDPAAVSGPGFRETISGYKIEELLDPEVYLVNKPSTELHELLKTLDPDSASEIHPNDKRKIMRSIQIFAQYGRRQSEILASQRAGQGGSSLGGALRFPESLMLWVVCDQNTLDKRLDDRVDDMLRNGLVEELRKFHNSIPDEMSVDYSKGVFQSIGLKELHGHLRLPEGVSIASKGESLLDSGITEMKRRTRQYSRKQIQWIRNRFLKRSDRALPKVFALDASDVSKWPEVEDSALSIIEDFISGTTPKIAPLEQEEVEADQKLTNRCQICQRDFVSLNQWRDHIKSNNHKRKANSKKREKMAIQHHIPRASDIVVPRNTSG